MPLFRRLNAAFVHVPKTGGQTVERVLGCSYTPADLYGVDGDVELSHLTAAEMAAREPAFFAAAFKFAFVRNPWDRVVSEYHYTGGRTAYLPRPAADFGEFVAALEAVRPAELTHVAASHVRPQVVYVGGPPLDFLGRFETFATDLRRVCARLGVKVGRRLPRVNASVRGPYQAYYTPETAAAVGRVYAADAETFGYRFGD